MPSGLVEFTGTDTSIGAPGGGFGTVTANMRDRDFATKFAHSEANGAWLGIDLGVAAVVTRIRVSPPKEPADFNPGDKSFFGAQLKSSSSGWPTFTSQATIATLGTLATTFFPALSLTPIQIPVSTARRHWQLYGADGSYGPQCAEMRWDGEYVDGIAARPVPPTISPWGGGYASGRAAVTLECLTTSARIYYTIDGSTPDDSATNYTGPFDLDFTAGDVTLKVIAIDDALSTPSSDVVSAVFRPRVFKAREDWHDNEGILVEAHGGGILDNRMRDGFFYWVGCYTNRPNTGVDILTNVGIWMYRSTDLRNWTKIGYILPNPSGVIYDMRPHLVYNRVTGKYVIFDHLNTEGGDFGSKIGISTADSVTGPWTRNVTNLDPAGLGNRDFNIWQEGDDLWLVYVRGANRDLRVCKMASDYLSVAGSHATILTGDREAPVLFRWNKRWYLITSSSNYYDSTATFNVSYISSAAQEPTSGWPSIPDLTAYAAAKTDLFSSDPVGSDFNGQPTAVLRIGNEFMYISDHWRPDVLYDSRYVFLPLVKTGQVIRAQRPEKFDISALFAQTSKRLGGGAFAAN